MARKPPPNPPAPGTPSDAPWFCQRCQQVVPAGRSGNHMKWDDKNMKAVICE
jgi:hypothetical protein